MLTNSPSVLLNSPSECIRLLSAFVLPHDVFNLLAGFCALHLRTTASVSRSWAFQRSTWCSSSDLPAGPRLAIDVVRAVSLTCEKPSATSHSRTAMPFWRPRSFFAGKHATRTWSIECMTSLQIIDQFHQTRICPDHERHILSKPHCFYRYCELMTLPRS